MQFTLLTTLANQHPPIIMGNRNKPLYCIVPDSLSDSLARARLKHSEEAEEVVPAWGELLSLRDGYSKTRSDINQVRVGLHFHPGSS